MSEIQTIINGIALFLIGIIGYFVNGLISDIKAKINTLEKEKLDKSDLSSYIDLILKPVELSLKEHKEQLTKITDLLVKQEEKINNLRFMHSNRQNDD